MRCRWESWVGRYLVRDCCQRSSSTPSGAIRSGPRPSASSSTSQDEQWWPIARQLGLRLQRARIAKGLSQEALAHAAGISTYTYQKFEKGESRPGTPMNPRLRTLIALAAALDMRVEELVGELSE